MRGGRPGYAPAPSPRRPRITFFVNALVRFFSLTAEQRRFVWRKQISDTRTPNDWLGLFRPLVKFETDASAAGVGNVLLGGIGVLSLISGVFTLTSRGGLGGGLIQLLISLVVLSFFVSARFLALRGRHVAAVLNPLFAILREDVKPGDGVKLSIDLRGPEQAAKRVGERTLPPRGNFKKIVETNFVDPWLEGDGTLADETRVTWTVTDYVRQTKCSKKSQSGKTKVKTKYRVITQLKLQMGLRNDRYAFRPDSVDTGPITDDGKRRWIKLRRTFGQEPQRTFDAGEFAQTVMSVFRKTESLGGAS